MTISRYSGQNFPNRRFTLTAGLSAALLLAGSSGLAQANEDPAHGSPIQDVLGASSSESVTPITAAVASAVASSSLLASHPEGSMRSLSVDGYLVFDEHVDALGDTTKTPELAAAIMAVPVNDPATAYDDSSVVLFAGAVSPATDANDWAFVALDVNGDLTDDFLLATPDLVMTEDEDYATEIYRVDGADLVGTGQGALWSRLSDGYVVGFDWRELGLTSTRFAFGLSDIDMALFDWAPDDYTGPLITLPPADSDGDGVIDSQDACPTVFGLASSGGCPPPPPDSDGDGVIDAQDACPTVPGSAGLAGCPDSDGDGVIDAQDACPTAPGSAGLGGCPDSDGDGVIDAQDACPTVAGAAASAGCPPPPAATVKVKAKFGRSKLYVDVNPNKGSGYWKFKVQKQRASGSWKSLKTYRTKGKTETRLIDLKKGTYRVQVKPKYGYLGVTSSSVYLKR